ncbi:unnamed protein product [Tilletia controversa]|nr:unnamed protein product [Tilletia controversa]
MLPDKTFVVMEPLQSLLEELAARMGKEAVYIHAENRTPKLFEEIKAGKFRMVFVSPEMAIGNAFKEVLLDSNFKASLGGIVFDECQVLKDWAVDSTFRKGIKDVSILRHLADIPGLAMSGTLPANYRKEVLRHFELNDPFVLDIGVDRPNIEYVVAPIRYPLASFRDILAWLPELHGTKPANDAEMRALKERCKPTIIYNNNKTQQLEMFRQIQAWYSRLGLEDVVLLVSADMSDSHRAQVKDLLESGRILCVISTSALGMGADLQRILRVIQWRILDSLAAIMQRLGRAGRNPRSHALGVILADPWAVPAAMAAPQAQADALLAAEVGEVDEEEPAGAAEPEAVSTRLNTTADEQIVKVVHHALLRKGCIRTMINDFLGQPSPENVPSAEYIFGPNIAKDGPCCCVCNPKELPKVPDALLPEKVEEGRARTGITKLQEFIEPKLRQWRQTRWKEHWSKVEGVPSWLGIAYFFRSEDVASVVKNLGKIDKALGAGQDDAVGDYVQMEAKSVVQPELTAWLKENIGTYDAEREKEREQQKAEADRRADERARSRAEERAAKKAQRASQAAASGNGMAGGSAVASGSGTAEGSGTGSGSASRPRTYSCKACRDWNAANPQAVPLIPLGHTAKWLRCPTRLLKERK